MSELQKKSIQELDLFASSNIIGKSNSIRPTNKYEEFKEESIEQSIAKKFEEQVKKYPENMAVITKQHQFTYKQLNSYSNRIASSILEKYDDSLSLTEDERVRYKRQMLLHGWGQGAQERFKATTVFVAGAGGSGSPLIMQLALLGIGKIIICDYDNVDLSNLNRQVLHDESRIGMNKALSAKQTINNINSNVEVIAISKKIDRNNIKEILQDASIIFDNVDDMEAKFLLSEIAVEKGIPHIISSMIDMNAYAAVFHTPFTPCFHCLYDKSTLFEAEKLSSLVENYQKKPNPVASPSLFMVTGFIVNEAIKLILNIDVPAYNKFFLFGQRDIREIVYTDGYQAIIYPFSSHFKEICIKQGINWEEGWENKYLEEIRIKKDEKCSICNYSFENNSVKEIKPIYNANCNSNQKPKNLESLQTVALLFEHGAEMIAGIIGTLKANKTYVPLDVSYPLNRLTYMLEDSRARLIVTNDKNMVFAKELRDKVNGNIIIINISSFDSTIYCDNINIDISSDSLAYVLYTSGSTGEPKGVKQNQRNVLHHSRVYINALHICSEDRLSLFSTYSFDAAKMDIFGALLSGATLYPYDIKKETHLQKMSEWIDKEKITIFHSIPTVYRFFISELPDDYISDSIRIVVLGGEAVFKNDVFNYKKYFNDNCLFINGLGPTESTLALQYFINKKTNISKESIPVGFEVDKTEVFLLNEDNKETSVFGIGEIVIKSQYIALGYLNKKEKTELVFTKDPRNIDGRVYKTGDLGRLLPDGSVEFVGRKDFQIKIRGYRVEIEEIEGKLDQVFEIEKSIVMCQQKGNENFLIAFYQLKKDRLLNEKDLLKIIKDSLPDYMIPNQFIEVKQFPKTSTGKIDRKALSNLNLIIDKDYIAPKNDVEHKLVEMWSKVLDIEQGKISINDNFFELGGYSLKATLLLSRIHKEFSVLIPLSILFESATIEKIALIIFHNKEVKTTEKEIEIEI